MDTIAKKSNFQSVSDRSKPPKSFGIRGRLLFGFSAIAFMLVIAICTALIILISTEKFAEQVINVDLPTYDALLDLNTETYHAENLLQQIVMRNDQGVKDQLAKSLETMDQIQLTIEDYAKNWTNPDYIKKWQQIKAFLDQFKIETNKVLGIVSENNSVRASQIFTEELLPLIQKLSDNFNMTNNSAQKAAGLLDTQSEFLHIGTQKILSDLSTVRLIEYTLLIISIIASIVFALITARNILTPLNKAIDTAKQIAAGERDVNIEITSHDETGELLTALDIMQSSIKESEMNLQKSEANTRELFDRIVKSAQMFSQHSGKVAAGDLRQRLDISTEMTSNDIMQKLGNDLNKMTDNLATISREITESCHNMVTSLEEVRHAVDSQSSGSSQQASSINEITASLSEIEKSSAQTMEKAKALGEVAERTREKGQMGLEAVEQSVQGMKSVRDKVQVIAQTILDLSNQTQQVGEITAVVNNLAQQSKMLALNASIEAAKAGEAGKGFAVVATEVKNLAEQSEHSTAQVQKILEDIRHATEKAVMVTEEGTKGVDYGTNLVEQTGEIIRNLNQVIHEATIASQQISAAVRQEGAGIEQITAGMNEINQVTTAFVESAQQTKEAMGNLSDIAKNLKMYVDTYKL